MLFGLFSSPRRSKTISGFEVQYVGRNGKGAGWYLSEEQGYSDWDTRIIRNVPLRLRVAKNGRLSRA